MYVDGFPIKYTISNKTNITFPKNKNLVSTLEFIASMLSIVSTILLAIFGNIAFIRVVCFSMFLISNMFMVYVCYTKKLKWFMISQIVFFITSIIGIITNLLIVL